MNFENLPSDILEKINEILKEDNEIEEFYKANRQKMIHDFIEIEIVSLTLIKNKEKLQSQNKWNAQIIGGLLNDLLMNKYGYTPAQINHFYINKWKKAKDIKDF